jgi:hypothetical protein
MTLKVPEILDELRLNRGYFPREAVEAAVERREEMVPELLRILDEAVERPEVFLAEDASFGHIYALYLLAYFREPAAFPRIVRLFRLPDEAGVELTGEIATDGLDRILATLNGGDVETIQRLIEDPEVSEWVRGAGVGALQEMVFGGQLTREETIAYLGELLDGKLERKYSNVWNCAVAAAADLHATELVPAIRRAYAEGLVDPCFSTLEEIEKALDEPRELVLERSRRQAKGPIEDVVEEMHWWACFHEPRWSGGSDAPAQSGASAAPGSSRPQSEARWPSTPQAFVREGPKVGRNDPCPCGSGKKYKRCCGGRGGGQAEP